jgi:N-acetylmuramoyl-L-alanine amidase CwlA
MTTQAQADAYYSLLLYSYEGQHINPDGAYGCQCKDVVDRYAMDLFGLPLFGAIAAGNAKTVDDWANLDYFDVIENIVGDPNSFPRLGDIAVFEGDAYNPFGHTAPILWANTQQMELMQQDGFAEPLVFVNGGWYSNKPAHRARMGYDNVGTGPCLYWLRPKLDKLRIPTSLLPMSTTDQESTMTKQYKLETKWTTGFQASRAFFGYADKPTGITIHHWGNDGQRFEDVCNFLCDTTSPSRVANPTSAHYVVEDGRIACLASPEVATYHSGSGAGNGSTVGIEAKPEMDKGTVDTLVQLIYELETAYGSLNIYFHKEWFATACPGRYQKIREDIIRRVNAMHANGGKDPALEQPKPAAPKPPAKPAPKPVAKKSSAQLNPEGFKVWSYKNESVNGDADAYALLTRIDRNLSAIKKKIGA